MNYAMTIHDEVIGVLKDQNTVPYWPPDSNGNPVVAIECDDNVDIGMTYNPETGEFTKYIPPEPEPPKPSQLDIIQEAVEKSNEELRQEGADAITLELLERGVL